MLRRIVGILVLVAVCSVAVAAQSHRLRSTWKAPGIEPLNFGGQKVAAVVISSDDSLRISAEEALTREITARGPEGIAAYRVIPRELLEDATKTRLVRASRRLRCRNDAGRERREGNEVFVRRMDELLLP